jgi:hypothetical protein
MELFLNLLWLAIAIAALIAAPRRTKRALFGIGCAMALLFPIVSVSDDLLGGQESFEETLAIVVKAVILLIALVVIAAVDAVRPRRAAFVALVSADPRSPPLG